MYERDAESNREDTDSESKIQGVSGHDATF